VLWEDPVDFKQPYVFFQTPREQTKGRDSLVSTVVLKVSQWRGNTLRRFLEEVQGESNALWTVLRDQMVVCFSSSKSCAIYSIDGWMSSSCWTPRGATVIVILSPPAHSYRATLKSVTRKSTWSLSLVLKASAMRRAASLCSRPLRETPFTSRMTWPTFSWPQLWAEPPLWDKDRQRNMWRFRRSLKQSSDRIHSKLASSKNLCNQLIDSSNICVRHKQNQRLTLIWHCHKVRGHVSFLAAIFVWIHVHKLWKLYFNIYSTFQQSEGFDEPRNVTDFKVWALLRWI